MRLINPTRAEERIVALYRKEKGYAADIFNTAVDAAQTIILDMYDNEAIEAEPIRPARWIIDKDGIPHCSECETPALQKAQLSINTMTLHCPPIMSKWCPACGCKMDGKEREDGKSD